ncbi:ComEA family DNA-binding protein [Shouchella clausii]|uniref:ComEA family DNA-binding protein n=1 Tax=Shouchella clausii TaxID=79880 RepID=UPI0012FE78A0|nr:helix-hairpin-helix domain-containing protein [Shouchella clausii]MCR1288638.1 helix-hairpin-helix domain-containing protein [Shouchella clausii]MEB5473491.1 helix-hairpin-helix domain-containing protein [Shouchella clausii]WQG94560.1 helix-hairpin-helix domain-containing protein [Shouchella clausii]
MNTLFLLFLLLTFFGLILGLIKPALVRFPTRKRVFAYGIPAFIITAFLFGNTLPSETAQSAQLDRSLEKIETLETSVQDKETEIEELTVALEEAEESLKESEEQLELVQADDSIEEQLEEAKLEWEEEFREQIEEELEERITAEISEDYEDKLAALDDKIKEKEQTIEEKETAISKLEEEVASASTDSGNATATTETETAQSSESASTDSCGPGTVKINSASESELQAIYEIGPDRAAQIIQLRPFSSYNDMKRIKGIGDARAEAIKNQGIVCFD